MYLNVSMSYRLGMTKLNRRDKRSKEIASMNLGLRSEVTVLEISEEIATRYVLKHHRVGITHVLVFVKSRDVRMRSKYRANLDLVLNHTNRSSLRNRLNNNTLVSHTIHS